MNKDDIRDYASLIRFIISENPGINQKQLAREMGISWMSFQRVKQGEIIPKENLANKIQGYVRKKYNITFKVAGNRIVIDKMTNSNIAVNHSNAAGRDITNGMSEEKYSYILSRLIELELENKHLRKLLNGGKK